MTRASARIEIFYQLGTETVKDLAGEKLMRLAIAKARKGIANGQEPFGACVVKGGEVISVAHNTIIEDMDVTAHTEMNAIRDACRKLKTANLSGCEIYATFKPCPMCQAACERANISKIYYGVARAIIDLLEEEEEEHVE